MSKRRSTKKATDANAPPGTEERIRRAALKEFSDKGLSGARVETIAQEADVNIRMIYYFFGSKIGLLEAVLSDIFQKRKAQLATAYDDVGELLASYFDGYSEDSQRVRLLQWEALQTPLAEGSPALTNFEDRREVIRKRIASIVDLQQRGLLSDRFDPTLLYLVFVALTIYPMTFPQSIFVATGEHATSEAFQHKYREFLAQLGGSLFGASEAKKAPRGRGGRGGEKARRTKRIADSGSRMVKNRSAVKR